MAAVILDGKALAEKTEDELTFRVSSLKQKNNGATPILATILVGNDPSSVTYVKMKANACRRIGMASLKIDLPADTSTQQLCDQISELNHNPNVHGILLQHPVPPLNQVTVYLFSKDLGYKLVWNYLELSAPLVSMHVPLGNG